jgi:hypothetical protein
MPVIISVTSTADDATGNFHPLGNLLAPFSSSLQRKYTSGLLMRPGVSGFPQHPPIRQAEFYTRTPGHHPLLINHWIRQSGHAPSPDITHDAVMRANLDPNASDPHTFLTSAAVFPAAVWELCQTPPNGPCILHGMTPAMPNSDYWIITCDKQIISGHCDIWSPVAMEMYAGLLRSAQSHNKARGGE